MEFGLTAILVPSCLLNRAGQYANADALSCIDKNVTLCFAQNKEGGMWQSLEGNRLEGRRGCELVDHGGERNSHQEATNQNQGPTKCCASYILMMN